MLQLMQGKRAATLISNISGTAAPSVDQCHHFHFSNVIFTHMQKDKRCFSYTDKDFSRYLYFSSVLYVAHVQFILTQTEILLDVDTSINVLSRQLA